MKSTDPIQYLIRLLSESSKEDYNAILRGFSFDVSDFAPFQDWSSEKYTRICLYKDDAFELVLLCWEQGHETGIHGHDGKDCWVYLLDGAMQEVFYEMDEDAVLRQTHSHNVSPGEVTFMNDTKGYHKLKNSHNGRSITLHVYAEPIETCAFYNEEQQQFVAVELHYDAVIQLAENP